MTNNPPYLNLKAFKVSKLAVVLKLNKLSRPALVVLIMLAHQATTFTIFKDNFFWYALGASVMFCFPINPFGDREVKCLTLTG